MNVRARRVLGLLLVNPTALLALYFCLSTMLAVIAPLLGVTHPAYWFFAYLVVCTAAYLPYTNYRFHAADAALFLFLLAVLWSWLSTGETGGRRTLAYIASSVVIPWTTVRLLNRSDVEWFIRYVGSFGAVVCIAYLAATPLFRATDPWERVTLFGGVAYGLVGPTVGLLAVMSSVYLTWKESRVLRGALLLSVVTIIHMGGRGMFVSALLTTLVATLVAKSAWRRRVSVLATFLAGAVIGAAVIPQARLQHFLRLGFAIEDPNRSIDDTAIERMGLYKEALDLFIAHPITGVGVGRFGLESSLNEALTTPHSTVLQVLAELGTAGGVPFLLLNALLLVLALRASRHGSLASILAGAWIYFASYDQISGNYFTTLRYYLFAALLVSASVAMDTHFRAQEPPVWKQRVRALGSALRGR